MSPDIDYFARCCFRCLFQCLILTAAAAATALHRSQRSHSFWRKASDTVLPAQSNFSPLKSNVREHGCIFLHRVPWWSSAIPFLKHPPCHLYGLRYGKLRRHTFHNTDGGGRRILRISASRELLIEYKNTVPHWLYLEECFCNIKNVILVDFCDTDTVHKNSVSAICEFVTTNEVYHFRILF